MARAPKMTILLPSLNVVSYIRECVESVLAQKLRDIEVLCIDSGSTDGTLEVLREFEAKDRRVRVLVAERKSYGLQMNMGLDAARGEYIGIVETDDWVPTHMFSDLYRLAKADDLDFVKADFYRFKVRPDGSLDKAYNRLSPDPGFYNRVLVPAEEPECFKFIMNTWSGIYRTDFLRRWNIRHNETPGASFQDNGFWFMTFARAERAMFVDKPYYMNRRDNPNSSVYSTSKVWAMRDEYDYIRSLIAADPERLAPLIPMCSYFRFCGYYYNTVKRVAPEYRREFVGHFSEEFRRLARANELDMSLFSKHQSEVLYQVMYSPERFVASLVREDSKFVLHESALEYLPADGPAPVKVSVVVPVYNVEAYLAECLDSVLAQAMPDFEVICVNDGSTDGSPAILAAYAAKDARVRVLDCPNAGPSRARNLGLAQARGEYVLCVDADDGLAPNALKALCAAAARAQADVTVFGFDPAHFPVAGEVPAWLASKNPVRNHTFEAFDAAVLFDEPGAKPFPWRYFMRRAFLAEHGLWFWEGCNLGEDTAFPFEMFPLARNITFLTDRLYWYRCVRPGSLMAQNNADVAEKLLTHVRVVSHVGRVWQALGILGPARMRFAQWAVDFVYDAFESLDEQGRARVADAFIPVLRQFLSARDQRGLGPGHQESIERMESCRPAAARPLGDAVDYAPGAAGEAGDAAAAEPLVSIVVPVHDNAATLPLTLNSLLGQTLPQVEVIAIDDASADDTPRILADYAARDARLRVVTYAQNKTANQARKDGVLAARGDYILFCDGDDTLEPTACADLLAQMQAAPVDILQFGVNVVSEGAFEEDRAWMEAHCVPFFGNLWGSDVFEGCFRGELYGFNLWNKMYSAALAREAFSHVQDGAFPRGQDVYAYTLLAYYAKSYRSVGARYYNYHLGLGMDGTVSLAPEKFASFCSLARVAEALKGFFREQGVYERYCDVADGLESRLAGDCLNKWHKKVADADKPACFQMMLKHWPAWRVVEGVARRYWGAPEALAKAFMAHGGDRACADVRCVAMYYHKRVGGGVEKVMEYLADLYLQMGVKVVVVTDIQGPADALALPEGVSLHMVPNAGAGSPGLYVERARALEQVLREEHVDVLLHHAWNTALLPWDVLCAQAAGVPVLAHCHNVFSMRALLGQAYFASVPWVFGMADGIVCLGEADKAFWSTFNANVHCVCNPLAPGMLEQPAAALDSSTVLWVGRFEAQKRPYDALTVFARVHAACPEARLQMLGCAPTPREQEDLEAYADNLGIREHVEFCGFQADPAPYYRNASVLLATSEYEGYFLVLCEAGMAGVPAVMYDMPYLTPVRGNGGVTSVPMYDTERAAQAVVALLRDDEARARQGAAGRAFMRELAGFDYRGAWERIFASLEQARAPRELGTPEMVMWQTLMSHYRVGAEVLERRARGARPSGEAERYRREVELIHASATYKVGRVLTWPARKLRTLLDCVREHGPAETLRIYLRRG